MYVVVMRASESAEVVITVPELPCRRKAGTRLFLLLVQDSVMHCRTAELSDESISMSHALWACWPGTRLSPRRL
jgi:hypothetical protein